MDYEEPDKRQPSGSLGLALYPFIPSKLTIASFQSVFRHQIAEVLSSLQSSRKSDSACTLDIAVQLEQPDGDSLPRSEVFGPLQTALGLLYTVIIQECNRRHIGVEHGNEINVRLFLVRATSVVDGYQGPILDLGALASSPRPWSGIYVAHGTTPSEALARRFAEMRAHKHPSMPCEPKYVGEPFDSSQDPLQITGEGNFSSGRQRHFSVAVGGTFDHLHAGHKLLLAATALILEPHRVHQVGREDQPPRRTLTVGITGDALLKNKKFAEYLESWDERQRAVFSFLSAIIDFTSPPAEAVKPKIGGGGSSSDGDSQLQSATYDLAEGLSIKCVEITDPFGPTITDETISALVVSAETRAGGKAVNDKRAERGWEPLEVFEVDVLDATESPEDSGTATTTTTQAQSESSFQSKISSTEIRRLLQEKERTD